MKINWQLFLGGKIMFWVAIILCILLIATIIITYIIDISTLAYVNVQKIDPSSIQEISEKYIVELGVTVDKNIVYRFVKYKKPEYDINGEEMILLGTFHEWNNTYYIDISMNLYRTSQLEEVVIHETRHMLVEYLRDKEVIDLTDYTEEIAQNEDHYYDELFNSGIYLLKKENNDD